MSGFRLPPPSPQSALHLYRHLLREAGYLPPVCRPYITDRIQTRFRRHRRDSEPGRSLKQANHDLRLLRAANAGDLPRMRRVLLATFGRIGPRRRELVSRLVTPDPPADTAALAKHIEKKQRQEKEAAAAAREAAPPGFLRMAKRKPDFLDRWDLDKLERFIKSQASQSQHALIDNPRPKIKSGRLHWATEIPTTNVWGRPLHPKPARTKLRKGWKDMIHRILPPVEKGEWDLLQSLAQGKADRNMWEVPARRPVARESGAAHESVAWDWEKPVQAAVRHLERQKSRRLMLLSGEQSEVEPLHAHRYTPRFWKRAYAKIWTLTATMERRKDHRDKWDIKWGGSGLEVSECTPAQHEFFEGLDAATVSHRRPRGQSPRTAPRQPPK